MIHRPGKAGKPAKRWSMPMWVLALIIFLIGIAVATAGKAQSATSLKTCLGARHWTEGYTLKLKCLMPYPKTIRVYGVSSTPKNKLVVTVACPSTAATVIYTVGSKFSVFAGPTSQGGKANLLWETMRHSALCSVTAVLSPTPTPKGGGFASSMGIVTRSRLFNK